MANTTLRKIGSALGTLVVIAAIGAFAYLKWWNVAGQGDLGEACRSRAGCKSFYCLEHEKVGGVEQKSAGYCTASCSSDSDCMKGMSCVVPSQTALDDLPKYGRPDKLCQRIR